MLRNRSPKEQDISSLAALYQTAFDQNARVYNLFQTIDSKALPKIDLLGKSIVSSSETPFAQFIKALNATDWVRHGHEQFTDTPNGKCPYCQQRLPVDFEDQIAACFDAQYQQDIGSLKRYKSDYASAITTIWNTLKVNLQDPYSKLELTEYQDKLTIFEQITKSNLQQIGDKIKEPASVIELEDMTLLLEEINAIIATLNRQIQENNDVVNAKHQKQAECKRKVWEHISFILQGEVLNYKVNKNNLETEISDLGIKIDTCHKSSHTLGNEIIYLNRQVVNTRAAVDSINNLLYDSGFQGFSLREKANVLNVYEVVREDGSIAENLSEGERNFIAFLYFYHLVRGSISEDETLKDKIVVIDDPVSSMDSGVLFIVSALVREMVEICHNNADYLENTEQGDYIKQIFILTHNSYFHREITYNQVKNYQYVSFYVIDKIDNVSTIRLCERSCSSAPSGKENYNPIQNAYAALWSEYREVMTPIPIMNVIRRILEYYFLQLCGYDGISLRKQILEVNRNKFIIATDNGQADNTRYHLASAMLSYINTSSNGITDGLNYVEECMDIELCRATFEMIFDAMGQGQHYEMMMGNNEGEPVYS